MDITITLNANVHATLIQLSHHLIMEHDDKKPIEFLALELLDSICTQFAAKKFCTACQKVEHK